MTKEEFIYPSPEFSRDAHVGSMDEYASAYKNSTENRDLFWGEMAEKELIWFEKWNKVLEWNKPFAKWFVGGKLNVSYNCLDRHLNTPTADKTAIIWEGEKYDGSNSGEIRRLTYRELHTDVSRFADVLKRQGVGRGDRVIIYMPMVPEVRT